MAIDLSNASTIANSMTNNSTKLALLDACYTLSNRSLPSPASLHAMAIDRCLLSTAYWGVSSSKAEKHLHLKSSWTISIHLRHLSQPQNLEMRPRNSSKGMVVSRIGVSYWHLGLGIGPQPLRREMLIWITHFQYIESYAWLLENIFRCPEQLNR